MSTTIETWMPDARAIAAQCWCDEETSSKEMDATLAEAVARRIAAWMETAAFHARNEEYWRDRAKAAESANLEVRGGALAPSQRNEVERT